MTPIDLARDEWPAVRWHGDPYHSRGATGYLVGTRSPLRLVEVVSGRSYVDGTWYCIVRANGGPSEIGAGMWGASTHREALRRVRYGLDEHCRYLAAEYSRRGMWGLVADVAEVAHRWA